jgi:hypothetical protein
MVAKVGTSKAGGTIKQQAAVHPWLAVDAHGNKQTNKQTNKPTNKQTNNKQTNKQTSIRNQKASLLERCGYRKFGLQWRERTGTNNRAERKGQNTTARW